jgi:tetratricopeptide (TPR) repeat protein
MPAPTPRVDKHGFPIPANFDSYQTARAGAEHDAGAPSPRRSSIFGRVFLVALLMVIVAAIVVESPIVDWARNGWIEFLVKRAFEKDHADDQEGALRDIDMAITWLRAEGNETLDANLHMFRASLRLATKQFDAALDDATRAIDLQPNKSKPYQVRSYVFLRQREYERAISDLDQAIRLSPGEGVELFNERAYVRALGNVDIDKGLEDVEKALVAHPDNPDYIDTRGFLYFLRGDTDKARDDLEHAVAIAEQQRMIELGRFSRGGVMHKLVEQRAKVWDRRLAVMYHHRGEVYEKLGRLDEAASDLNKAEKLGYNPDEGVY